MSRLVIAKTVDRLRYVVSLASGYCLPFGVLLSRLSLKPLTLGFQTTDYCNAKCIFCDSRNIHKTRGAMPMEIFKKGLADFVDIGGGNLSFTPPVGEPLLDPLLLERIRYARAFKEIKDIGFFTNGIALDKFESGEILKSGVTTIIISFDNFNRESYERIFGVDEFEHAYRNIIGLATANRERSEPVRIEVALRIERPIREIAREPLYRQMATLLPVHYQYRMADRSSTTAQQDLPGIMHLKKSRAKHKPCCVLYADGPMILRNGDVVICGCRDVSASPELLLGNILSESLIALWRSDKLREVRLGFSCGSVPDACRHCSDYNEPRILRTIETWKAARESVRVFLASQYARRTAKGGE